MLPGYYPLYPRGAGAATGPLPPGHVMVSRWVGEAEARMWMGSGATHVPPGLGAGGHLSVGEFGASRIPGTDPIRIDFSFPKAGLQKGGRTDWKFIIQVVANVPIYNVVVWVPVSVAAFRITGKK